MKLSLRSLLDELEETIPGGFEGAKQRVTESFKKDPLQYTPLSMRERIVPAVRGLGTYAEQQGIKGAKQIADDVGYTLRGALAVTPFQRPGENLDRSTPQTQRQQFAESAGSFAYGSAMTYPIGGIAGITSRAIKGAGIGAAFATGGKILSEGRLPTGEELKSGARSGMENSWVLALTGLGLDAALSKAAINYPSLLKYTSAETGLPFGSLSQAPPEMKRQIFVEGAKRLLGRAMFEVLPENTAFTFLDKVKGREKESFVDAWVRNLPSSIASNIAFAGLQIVKGGTYDWNKTEVDAALTAFKNALGDVGMKLSDIAPIGLTARASDESARLKTVSDVIEQKRAELKRGKDEIDIKELYKQFFDKNYTDKTFFDHLERKGWQPDQIMEMANRVDYIMNKSPDSVKRPEGLTYYFLRQQYGDVEKKIGPSIDYEQYKPSPGELAKINRASMEYETEMRAIKSGVDTVRASEIVNEVEDKPQKDVVLRVKQPKQPKEVAPKVESVEPKTTKQIFTDMNSARNKASMTSGDRDLRISEAYSTLWKNIESFAELDKQTLYKYIKGQIPAPNKQYIDAANESRKLWKVFELAEPELASGEIKKMDRYTPDYTPEQIIGTIMEDFPTSRITTDILELHHLKSKSDPDRIHEGTSLEDVWRHRLLSGIYNVYRNAKITDTPATKAKFDAEEKIIQHVKATEADANKSMDYVGTLNKVSEAEGGKKKISKYVINAIAPGGDPIRTENDIFSKIGGKLFTAFRDLRDFRDVSDIKKERLLATVNSDDPLKEAKVINYFINVLGVNPETQSNFTMRSMLAIKKFGLEGYTSYMFRNPVKNQVTENFLDTVGKYEFENGRTKQFINDFIDRELKSQRAEAKLYEKTLDLINDTFAMAHIGGNIKVALAQSTEVNRLPAVYGFKNAGKGVVAATLNKNGIAKKYGIDQKPVNFEAKYQKTYRDVPKTIKGRVKSFLFAPLQFFESWKNSAYAGAAEAEAKSKGLEGEELLNYVRDSVFKHAHMADYYNTPVFMKNSAVYRSALQYSQFAIKNLFGKVDAAQEKEYTRLAGLLIADVISAGSIALATGYPLNWVFSNLFPSGLGPIANVPLDIFKYYNGMNQAKAEGNESSQKYNEYKFKRTIIGSLVPAGTQYNKTMDMVKLLQQGYAETTGGRVKYLANFGPTEIPRGFAFGTAGLSETKKYYQDVSQGGYGGQALGEKQSELVKQEIAQGGTGENWFYRIIANRQKSLGLKDLTKEVADTATPIFYENKLYYPYGDDTRSIDLSSAMSKKKSGIDGYKQKESSIKTAVDIYELDSDATHVSPELKRKLIGQMGFRYEDIVYESYAGEDTYVKSNYLFDMLKNKSKEDVMASLLKGRTESLTGDLLANDSTLRELRDKGLITDDEYDWLRKQKFNSQGDQIGEVAYEKQKKIGIKVKSAPSVPKFMSSSPVKIKAPSIKAGGVSIKPPKIEAPDLIKISSQLKQPKIKISQEDFTPPKLTV